MIGLASLTRTAIIPFAAVLLASAAAAQTAPKPASVDQSAPDTPAQGTVAPGAAPGQPPAPPPPSSFTTSGAFSFSAALTADVLADVAGGITHGVKLLTKSNLSVTYDGGAANHPGWSGQASIQYTKGGHISAANVGDVQGLDDIEATNALRLYELWLARQWQGGKYGVKFGLTDLNVDFDTQQVAALFINSADGIGPEFGHSGLNGPSIYPTTTLGLSGFVKPSDAWTLRAGAFNGLAGAYAHPGAFVAIDISARNGALLVVQAEHTGASGLRSEVGAWTYTASYDELHAVDGAGNPLRAARMRGVYGLVEGQIYKFGDHPVAGWLRIGLGDPKVERVSGYVGLGLVTSGLLKGRAEDQAGISINHAIVDEPNLPPLAAPAKRAETAVELTYRIQARDWLAVQPDLQYVHRPNGDPAIASALVVGVRLSVNLTRNLVQQFKGDN
jgi:porin